MPSAMARRLRLLAMSIMVCEGSMPAIRPRGSRSDSIRMPTPGPKPISSTRSSPVRSSSPIALASMDALKKDMASPAMRPSSPRGKTN